MAIALAYEKRSVREKPKALRKTGKVPAVFYGSKQKTTSVMISAKEFVKVFKKAGENTVVVLQDGNESVETLIQAVDRHPVSSAVLHVDFYAFEKGQKLKVKVPIEFTGVAPAVKELGGVVVKVLRELEIEATPKDLPQKISVDITTLVSFESVITAKEISLPSGVLLITNPEEVVVSVYEPKEEAVEEVPVDLSAIEVAKKGKELKEGEEVAAGETVPGEKDAKKDAKKEEKKEPKKEDPSAARQGKK